MSATSSVCFRRAWQTASSPVSNWTASADGLPAKLYPNADIKITGYENTKFADNSFDVAIGNVPFGDYSLHDKRYDKDHLLIHDYFFVKTLDKVRPGGIVAFVTSKGTLDKANPAARRLMAERADLLGAIRLPNTAFKANAGASVTTDILFLQKRDTPPEQLPAWTEIGKNADGMELNNYFLQHPEMILGIDAGGHNSIR